jgi:predicted phage gp36 major capsid-like protein
VVLLDRRVTFRVAGFVQAFAERGHIKLFAHVRFGSEADIRAAIGHVRFTPESGH